MASKQDFSVALSLTVSGMRKALGLTQVTIQEMTGVPQATLSRLEAKSLESGIGTLYELSEAFSSKFSDFIAMAEKMAGHVYEIRTNHTNDTLTMAKKIAGVFAEHGLEIDEKAAFKALSAMAEKATHR